MDLELKKLVDEYIEIINSPEYKRKNEEWMMRFWKLMRDYALGLVDEDAFDELDEEKEYKK